MNVQKLVFPENFSLHNKFNMRHSKNSLPLLLAVALLAGSAALKFSPSPPIRPYADVAINNQNGGFWLLDTDKKMYSTDFNLAKHSDAPASPPLFDDISSHRGTAFGIRASDKTLMAFNSTAWLPIPPGTLRGKRIAVDRETGARWYIGLDDLVRNADGTGIPATANKPAKALAVWNSIVYIVGRDDSKLYKFASGSWSEVPGAKALKITVDVGMNMLWFINAADKQVYYFDLNGSAAPTISKYPAAMKAKSIVAFGRSPYIIGEDGNFYAGINNGWVKGNLAPL